MPKNIVVLGPPGTGKTTAAVGVTKGWINSGISPNQIAYLAFTKAAANEAAGRILDDDFKKDYGEQLPYFRTLHSLAYRGLRRERTDVRLVTTSDMKLFSMWSGYEGVFAITEAEDLMEAYQNLANRGRTDWDKCFSAYTLSRICSKDRDGLERAKHMPSALANKIIGIDQATYRAFVVKYEAFKAANGLIDFTDMLAYALTEMRPLDEVKYAVVDEVQDLAPILYSITDRLFQGAQELWLAGDEDQAIFNFAASDAKLFIDRAKAADARIYLRQTHRFGKQIVDFSGKIIRRVHERVKKEVLGYEGREHNIRTIGEFQPIVGSSMLLLHRHVMGCQALAAAYIADGKPFRNERGKDPLGSYARVKGYQALKDLADGKSVSMASVERLVDDLMPSMVVDRNGEKKRLVVHGGKKKVSEGKIRGDANIMDLLQAKVLTVEGAEVIRQKHFRALKHPDDLEYYDRVVENGYSLEQACPIITTIHGSKGRQADQVVLFAEMGKKCWEDPDTEHRLAYVGATRTRGELTICQDRMVEYAEEYYDYPEVKKDVTQKDTGVR